MLGVAQGILCIKEENTGISPIKTPKGIPVLF